MKTQKSIFLLSFSMMLSIAFSASAQSQWALDTVLSAGSHTTGIAITSDGKKIVVSNNTKPGQVRIINTSTFAQDSIDISSIENFPNGVAINPNDSIAYIATLHDIIYIDIPNHSSKGAFASPCAGTTLYGLTVTPDGNTVVFPDLASNCIDQVIRSISAKSVATTSTSITVSTKGELYGIDMAGKTSVVVTANNAAPLEVGLSTSNVLGISGLSSSYGVASLHNSAEALINDGDSIFRVSLKSLKATKTICALFSDASFQNISITSDDKYAIAVGSFDKVVIDLDSNKVIQSFASGAVNAVIAPDGSFFYVTDSYNGAVRVYKKSITNGIAEAEKNTLSISIYPNPASDVLNISSTGESFVSANAKIYNLQGQCVQSLVNITGNTFSIPRNGQSKGMYLLKIQDKEGKSATTKFVWE